MSLSRRFGTIVPVNIDSTDEDSDEDDQFLQNLLGNKKSSLFSSPTDISFYSMQDCVRDSETSGDEIDPEWKLEFQQVLKQSKAPNVENRSGKSAVCVPNTVSLPLESLKAAIDRYNKDHPNSNTGDVQTNNADTGIAKSGEKENFISSQQTKNHLEDHGGAGILTVPSPKDREHQFIDKNEMAVDTCSKEDHTKILNENDSTNIHLQMPDNKFKQKSIPTNKVERNAQTFSEKSASASVQSVEDTNTDSSSEMHSECLESENSILIDKKYQQRKEVCVIEHDEDVDYKTSMCNEVNHGRKMSNVLKETSDISGSENEHSIEQLGSDCKLTSPSPDKEMLPKQHLAKAGTGISDSHNVRSKTNDIDNATLNRNKVISTIESKIDTLKEEKKESLNETSLQTGKTSAIKEHSRITAPSKSDKSNRIKSVNIDEIPKDKQFSPKDNIASANKGHNSLQTGNHAGMKRKTLPSNKCPNVTKAKVAKIDMPSTFPLDELLPMKKEQSTCKPTVSEPPEPPRKVCITEQPDIGCQIPVHPTFYQNYTPYQPYNTFHGAFYGGQSVQDQQPHLHGGFYQYRPMGVVPSYPLNMAPQNRFGLQQPYSAAIGQPQPMITQSQLRPQYVLPVQSQFSLGKAAQIPMKVAPKYPLSVNPQHSSDMEQPKQNVPSCLSAPQVAEEKPLAHNINHIMSLIENGNQSALSVIQNALNRDISMNLKALAYKARQDSELAKVTNQLQGKELAGFHKQQDGSVSRHANANTGESNPSDQLFHLFVQQCSEMVKTENDKDMLKSLVKLLKNESGNQLTGTGFTPPDFEESVSNEDNLTSGLSPCNSVEPSGSKGDMLFEGRTMLKGGVHARHIPKTVVRKNGKKLPKDPRRVGKKMKCSKFLPLPKFALTLYKEGKLSRSYSRKGRDKRIKQDCTISAKESNIGVQNKCDSQKSKLKDVTKQCSKQNSDNLAQEKGYTEKQNVRGHSKDGWTFSKQGGEKKLLDDVENVKDHFAKCDIGVKRPFPSSAIIEKTCEQRSVARTQSKNEKTLPPTKMAGSNFVSTEIERGVPTLYSGSSEDENSKRKKIAFKILSIKDSKVPGEKIQENDVNESVADVNGGRTKQNSIPVLISSSHDQTFISHGQQNSSRCPVLHNINLLTSTNTGSNQIKESKPCIGIVKPMPYETPKEELNKLVCSQDIDRNVVSMDLDSDIEEGQCCSSPSNSEIDSSYGNICKVITTGMEKLPKELSKDINTHLSKAKCKEALNSTLSEIEDGQLLDTPVTKTKREDYKARDVLEGPKGKSRQSRKRSLSCSSSDSLRSYKSHHSESKDPRRSHKSSRTSIYYDERDQRDRSYDKRRHDDKESYRPYEGYESSHNRKRYRTSQDRDSYDSKRQYHSPARKHNFEESESRRNRSRTAPELNLGKQKTVKEFRTVTNKLSKTSHAPAATSGSLKVKSIHTEYGRGSKQTRKDCDYDASVSKQCFVEGKPVADSDLSDEAIAKEYREIFRSVDSISHEKCGTKKKQESRPVPRKSNNVASKIETPLYIVNQTKKKRPAEDLEAMQDRQFLENYRKKLLKKPSDMKQQELHARKALSRDDGANARNITSYADALGQINQELEEGETL